LLLLLLHKFLEVAAAMEAGKITVSFLSFFRSLAASFFLLTLQIQAEVTARQPGTEKP
jgi:hypothetical protein